MRRLLLLALLVSVLIGAAIFALRNRPLVLEAKYAEVHLTISRHEKGCLVSLSGWIMHSGLCVGSMSIDRSGDRMIARVSLLPPPQLSCESTFRGSFYLPADVDEIWLGTPADTIYLRNRLAGRFLLPQIVHDWVSGRGGAIIWRRPGGATPKRG